MTVRLLAVAVLLASPLTSRGQTTAAQAVTIVIEETSAISVTSSPVTLTIEAATPGEAARAVSDAATTYAITTNATAKKITGLLDADFANGVQLDVHLSAPEGAASEVHALSASAAADLVTRIANVATSGLTITYTARATTTTPPDADTGGQRRVITFTITDG